MSYSIADLNEAITSDDNDWGGSWHEFIYVGEHYDSDTGKWGFEPLNLPGIGIATILEDHGGGEGSGEERWFVFSVVEPNGTVRTFRRNGHYASFVGSAFNGPTVEVQSVQKTITVWESK